MGYTMMAPTPKWVRNKKESFITTQETQLFVHEDWNSEYFSKIFIDIKDDQLARKDSHFSVTVNPFIEKFTLHTVVRQRGSLKETITQKCVIKHFDQMVDHGMFDEVRTIHVILPDVRKGDTYEMTYTISSKSILGFYEKFLYKFQKYVRVILPKKQTFIKIHGVKLKKEANHYDNYDTFSFELTNHDQYVELSSFNSFKNISKKIYEFYKPVPLSKKIISFLEGVKKMNLTEEQMIPYVIQYVQNHIRYISIHHGSNQLKPENPNVVFDRGYGDCKDLTNVCVHMLNYLNIKAHPFLVRYDSHCNSMYSLPSITHFNHVIVAVKTHNEWFYFDATSTDQKGDLRSMTQSYYHYGLLVSQTGDDLIYLKPKQVSRMHIKKINPTNIEITFSKGFCDLLREKLDAGAKDFNQAVDDFFPMSIQSFKFDDTKNTVVVRGVAKGKLSIDQWVENKKFQDYFELDIEGFRLPKSPPRPEASFDINISKHHVIFKIKKTHTVIRSYDRLKKFFQDIL